MEEPNASRVPDEILDNLTTVYREDVYAFANWAHVNKPGEVVHIDFAQIDVAANPPDRATVVARVVLTQALATDLVAELSKVLPTSAD